MECGNYIFIFIFKRFIDSLQLREEVKPAKIHLILILPSWNFQSSDQMLKIGSTEKNNPSLGEIMY